ncbi:GNAT family N-acetyltransferase [Enterococcus sp. DIV0170]|uniref:GNAT family N-acetyltransferase n=1 Tax=Enterococcus sp. DIV0170 TaxID=2774642 RepID=UPI003F245AA8
MNLIIKDIDETNWRAVVALSVAKNQEEFIESNGQSLLEAAYDVSLNWRPLALYDENQLVGFSMIGAKRDESMWLDRLMIDARFQRNGYGGLFIPLLIDYMKAHYLIKRIYLSVHEENKKIIPYYQRFGFIDSNQYDPENGERIMYLEV